MYVAGNTNVDRAEMGRAGRSTCLPPLGLAGAQVTRRRHEDAGSSGLSDSLCETNQEFLSSKSSKTTPLANRD